MDAQNTACACAFPTALMSADADLYFRCPRPTTNAVNMRRDGKASIESLPLELLVAIFREAIRQSKFDEWNPSALAFVCSLWRNVALSTPEFWTRIVILIDLPYFSTSSIATAFSRSHNLVLEEINVIRHNWDVIDDECERERVMSVMQIINLHIHRCSAILFDVLVSSSLPSFPDDFHGNAKHLHSLELKCMEDDGGAPAGISETSPPSIQHEPFQCPHLRELIIDGRNYFNACQRNINWTKMFSTISALWISHFTPVANRSESFTLSDLMRSVHRFRDDLITFYIDDIHLDESPTPILHDDDLLNHSFNLKTITLNNMHNARCMTQITDFFGWSLQSDVHIVHCCLDPRYICGGALSLEDIDGGEDLVGFLRNCLSTALVINDCPGFDDAVLMAMTISSLDADQQISRCCARFVKRLSIVDCPDFSVSALKQMVETRRFRTAVSQPPPLNVLQLSGRVPYVSAEDKEWFKSRLSDFSYEPVQ